VDQKDNVSQLYSVYCVSAIDSDWMDFNNFTGWLDSSDGC